MLTITVPGAEYFNPKTEEFIYTKDQILTLEHSLVSLSKWESKWQIAFLSSEQKTNEQMIDYIRCMTLTQNVNPEVYTRLTEQNIKDINDYIDSPMTATTFSDTNTARSREKITAEIIYYWMIAQNIPFECQKWHLNRLLALIKVCSIKNAPPKKMTRSETINRNRALNEARRKSLGTKG